MADEWRAWRQEGYAQQELEQEAANEAAWERGQDDRTLDLFHGRQLDLDDATPFQRATERMGDQTRPVAERRAELAATLRAEGKGVAVPRGQEQGFGR